MNTRLTPNQNSYSSDETDDETVMSQSEDELDERLSQQLIPKTAFQAAFGRPTEQKRSPNPKLLEELRDVFYEVDCTELTHFPWKRVEEHEGVNGAFKHIGDMYSWIRKKTQKLQLCTSRL